MTRGVEGEWTRSLAQLRLASGPSLGGLCRLDSAPTSVVGRAGRLHKSDFYLERTLGCNDHGNVRLFNSTRGMAIRERDTSPSNRRGGEGASGSSQSLFVLVSPFESSVTVTPISIILPKRKLGACSTLTGSMHINITTSQRHVANLQSCRAGRETDTSGRDAVAAHQLSS